MATVERQLFARQARRSRCEVSEREGESESEAEKEDGGTRS